MVVTRSPQRRYNLYTNACSDRFLNSSGSGSLGATRISYSNSRPENSMSNNKGNAMSNTTGNTTSNNTGSCMSNSSSMNTSSSYQQRSNTDSRPAPNSARAHMSSGVGTTPGSTTDSRLPLYSARSMGSTGTESGRRYAMGAGPTTSAGSRYVNTSSMKATNLSSNKSPRTAGTRSIGSRLKEPNTFSASTLNTSSANASAGSTSGLFSNRKTTATSMRPTPASTRPYSPLSANMQRQSTPRSGNLTFQRGVSPSDSRLDSSFQRRITPDDSGTNSSFPRGFSPSRGVISNFHRPASPLNASFQRGTSPLNSSSILNRAPSPPPNIFGDKLESTSTFQRIPSPSGTAGSGGLGTLRRSNSPSFFSRSTTKPTASSSVTKDARGFSTMSEFSNLSGIQHSQEHNTSGASFLHNSSFATVRQRSGSRALDGGRDSSLTGARNRSLSARRIGQATTSGTGPTGTSGLFRNLSSGAAKFKSNTSAPSSSGVNTSGANTTAYRSSLNCPINATNTYSSSAFKSSLQERMTSQVNRSPTTLSRSMLSGTRNHACTSIGTRTTVSGSSSRLRLGSDNKSRPIQLNVSPLQLHAPDNYLSKPSSVLENHKHSSISLDGIRKDEVFKSPERVEETITNVSTTGSTGNSAISMAANILRSPLESYNILATNFKRGSDVNVFGEQIRKLPRWFNFLLTIFIVPVCYMYCIGTLDQRLKDLVSYGFDMYLDSLSSTDFNGDLSEFQSLQWSGERMKRDAKINSAALGSAHSPKPTGTTQEAIVNATMVRHNVTITPVEDLTLPKNNSTQSEWAKKVREANLAGEDERAAGIESSFQSNNNNLVLDLTHILYRILSDTTLKEIAKWDDPVAPANTTGGIIPQEVTEVSNFVNVFKIVVHAFDTMLDKTVDLLGVLVTKGARAIVDEVCPPKDAKGGSREPFEGFIWWQHEGCKRVHRNPFFEFREYAVDATLHLACSEYMSEVVSQWWTNLVEDDL